MREFHGLAASPGIAIGAALWYVPIDITVSESGASGDSASELSRLSDALEKANAELTTVYEKARAEAGDDAAAVFLAHQEFLSDPVLLAEVNRQVVEQRVSAQEAVESGFETYAQQLEKMSDAYFQERAVDVRDVSRRVRLILAGVRGPNTLADLASPVIVVARDLTPSDTAQMNKKMVLGFCTAVGGLTSHTAIIARILGIPAVVGLGEQIAGIDSGRTIIVDGSSGVVVVDANASLEEAYAQRRDALVRDVEVSKESARAPAVTKDGRKVEIAANIADAGSAELSLGYGAEGVGLFRTEYLFLNRHSVPTEEEQYGEYRAVADVLGSRPLIIRTLDIGGDKQLSYLDIAHEMNPFLGWRAIRLCLDSPEVFEPQLRAILRASADRNVQIMFPMVATVEEVIRARRVLDKVKADLTVEGVSYDPDIEVGIMVEVPSAALMADVLAQEVDFFSIGTNDLIQYTLACDRVNEKVAYLYEPLHPAVLRLIKGVISSAHQAGKWVGMCGEMAGDLEAIPLLLGLGLDEFSMNATAIPAAKALIRSLSMSQAQEIAAIALEKKTASEVREYMGSLGLAQSF